MKKKLVLSAIFVLVVGFSAQAKVYIKYVNLDRASYTFDVMIGGQKTSVNFGSNRTTSVMIPGEETVCTIITPCGKFDLNNGSKIVIRGGCIKVE